MAIQLLSELVLGGGGCGYSFEVVPDQQKDADTYRAGLEVEKSLESAPAEEQEKS